MSEGVKAVVKFGDGDEFDGAPLGPWHEREVNGSHHYMHVDLGIHCYTDEGGERTLSPEYARWFESVFMVGFFFGMQSMIQNLTQVTIATMLVAEYVPYWNRRTAACEEPIDRGGVPGSEWASSFLATAIFYFIGPFIIVCNLT